MPHKCVSCDEQYEDDSEVVMEGCACGSKVFQYVRQNGTVVPVTEGVYSVNVKRLFKSEEESTEDTGIHDIDVKTMLKRETLKRKRS